MLVEIVAQFLTCSMNSLVIVKLVLAEDANAQVRAMRLANGAAVG
jgi:hypothetical protein